MLRTRLLLACLLASVAAIASCGPKQRMAVFDPAEYRPFDRAGTGVITGQAFIRTQGGGVVTAAGLPVYLNPVTTYSTEWYEQVAQGHQELAPADGRADSYSRTAQADADGQFSFDGLPAGDYYLASWISWEVPVGYYGGGVASTRTERYVAHAKVSVQNGQTTRAIVTR